MNKLAKWLGYGVAALVVLLLVAGAALYLVSSSKLDARVAPRPVTLAAATPEQLADGPRMLRVYGCIDCHGEGLRGKKFLDESGVGTLYAPNIALIAASMSDAAFEAALRQGVGRDGRSLFVMPSNSFQHLTDGEVRALIAAIRALPPGGTVTPPITLGPLGRLGVVTGKFANAPTLVAAYAAAAPLPHYTPDTEVGRHLVETSCADCHGADLKGKEVEPGVVSVNLDIAGAYDLAQFTRLMRTGMPPSNRDLGLMAQMAKQNYVHLTDAEIASIHAYLVARAQGAPAAPAGPAAPQGAR